jgi:3-deoxy-D-manno-octulosonate 8-phosphate phosphatase (KDO 8-P phosphatase)
VLDVDGTLTDGRLYIDDAGRPTRAFHVHDGLAIEWFQKLGGTPVILTAKSSSGIAARAAELGIRHVVQNSRDKLGDLRRVLSELGLALSETAAVGDDLNDLPVLRNVARSYAPANAAAEVKAAVTQVLQRAGGHGAVREAIEHLLREAGHWANVVAHYDQAGRDEAR